jgi:hypothetical protein
VQKFLLSRPPEIIKDSPDYFITGNKHFFENPLIAKKLGLKIIKPQEFLETF